MHDARAPHAIPHPVTLAIWPINPDGSCACGTDSCRDAGKHPRPYMPPDPSTGYGIRCGELGPKGSGIFVVDLDEKPGVSGIRAFHDLCLANGLGDLPATLVVSTGGGGFHFFFWHPGFPVKNSVGKLAKGVDIRGDGGWVVGPGSPHASGRPYVVVHDAPIAVAPAFVLDWPGLRKGVTPLSAEGAADAWAPTPVDPASPEGQRRIEAFRSECAGEAGHLSPSVSGANGHAALFHAAKRGTIFYVLPAAVVAALISEFFNPRCSPPWAEAEIQRKVGEAIRTNREVAVGPTPDRWGERLLKLAIMFPDGPQGPRADPSSALERPALPDLDTDTEIPLRVHDAAHRPSVAVGESIANGKLGKRSASEITFRLRRSPEWSGVLRYDEFTDAIRAVDPPVALDAERDPQGLSDRDITAIQIWFEVAADTSVATETLRACLVAAAKASRVHPVREYLYGLPCGDPSIFHGLADRFFGARTDLADDLLRRFLVAAVRRILRPGEQVDTMLVLYSHVQGLGKSQWVRSMFGSDWSLSQMPDLAKTDASQQIGTTWCAEIGELDRLLRVDATTSKDFLSRCVDDFRPPYGHAPVRRPRQAVFVGTTNDLDFLRDPTGSRRFWPITVTKQVDQADVRSVRDRVWAGALRLALTPGFEHWIDPGTVEDDALRGVQAIHAHRDAWHPAIVDYCAARGSVTVGEVYRVAIMKCDTGWISRFTKREADRVAGVLRSLGSTPCGDAWILPPEIALAAPSADEVRRRATEARAAGIGPLAALAGVTGGR